MSRVSVALLLAVTLVASACSSSDAEPSSPEVQQPDDPVEPRIGSYAGTEPAPEFPDGLEWINVDAPLSISELRGKVVLLDFWTYGCINCIHVIPDLKRLEEEYPDELVVIGVHSAKFVNEGETDNIRDIVARYDLEHPVVNDRNFEVWRQWGARAWPTLVLIDPAGNVVGGHAGEGIYPIFQPVIDSLVAEFDDLGLLDRSAVEVSLERDRLGDSVLSFPGKVLADPVGNRLFVADTNHHRIVIADLETNEIIDVAGDGARGLSDTGFDRARFDQPQGMDLSEDGTVLYVADTGNHSIRALDLEARTVSTLLGTGAQAGSYPPLAGVGPEVALSSPWDVVRSGTELFIAMAGSHQLWRLDLSTGEASWYVGNGRESTRNGPRLEAELAQPSAVAVLPDGTVAFADSESSAIRFARPGAEGETGVLAGTDVDLFTFGDVDGVGTEALLQHPLGLDFGLDALWVADTYNSKIKRLDPATSSITTFAGGEQGWSDGVGEGVRFSEPGGVSFANGWLYVADTNNHAIRVIDVASGEVSTLVLYGIERFPSATETGIPVVSLGEFSVAAGAGTIAVDVVLPDGFKVNDIAPFTMEWSSGGSTVSETVGSIVGPTFPVQVPVEFEAGSLAVDLTLYYCTDDAEALCFIDQVRLEAEVLTDGTDATVEFGHEVVPPGV